jgi:hypothetical protein
MKINKTQRRVGFHQAMPKAAMPKLVKTQKFPTLKPLPKLKAPKYGGFPSGHVY